ncbi:MAG: hypothetical protein MR510_03015 [Clostridium sp.]|uniref:hypothetical protein n=1 Tax=Clostridium sp. TaxID=1506 RepID=UPI002A83E6E5|nr:hypothetical protein [Clostridium sp.]MCI6691454.1 hypothetical protein [Clostridium sp.]MDY4250887.1 hypothetical protein [Clostridium sp.]
MALQKSRAINNIPVDYWKVSGVNITYTGKMAQIYIIGFSNTEKRQEGIENKIAFETYICKGEDFDTYFSVGALDSQGVNPITSSYKYLKEKVGVFVESVDT